MYNIYIQVQAYTLETLIANVGGYVGLILGYAILQVPFFVLNAFVWIKSIFTHKFRPSSNTIMSNDNSITPRERSKRGNNDIKEYLESLQEDIKKVNLNVKQADHVLSCIIQYIREIEDKMETLC